MTECPVCFWVYVKWISYEDFLVRARGKAPKPKAGVRKHSKSHRLH